MCISPLSILLFGSFGITLAAGKCTPEDIDFIKKSGKFNEFVYDCSFKNAGSGPETSKCVMNGCGISQACAECYGQSTSCGVPCAGNCAVGGKPSDQACQDCLNSKGCNEALLKCTGLDKLPPAPSDTSTTCK